MGHEDKPGALTSGSIYTIAPHNPFLRVLARFLLSCQSPGGTRLADDPAALAASIVFLPTRRAARSFSVALLEEADALTGATSILMPRIVTLGDADETETLMSLGDSLDDASVSLAASEPIGSLQRRFVLARLVRHWIRAMTPQSRKLLAEERIALPASAADALWLADSLARLMDQVETEEADWGEIASAVPTEQQDWWQITLAFLSIVMESWPDFLAANGLVGPARHRSELTDLRIRMLSECPPAGVVIAAGTTGSIPATARLLSRIAAMPNGAVVLPGLDTGMPEAITRALREDPEHGEEAVRSTHPQFGMSRLLKRLGYRNADTIELAPATGELATRRAVISAAMLPAEHASGWREIASRFERDAIEAAFAGVTIVEARNEQQEALAIALALRRALEIADRTAALVTPDRGLARRVSAELERFGIEIDDSAGRPVRETTVAGYLTTLLRAVTEPENPVALSDLIKSTVLNQGDALPAELLELAILRDQPALPPLAGLERAVRDRQTSIDGKRHAPRQLRALTATQWDALANHAARISLGIRPLCELVSGDGEIAPAQLCRTLREAARGLAGPDTGFAGAGAADPFLAEGGRELAALLDNTELHGDGGFTFPPHEALAVFEALLAPLRLRQSGRTHPRLHIYGALEARLQHHDVMILGGMNEGNWPAAAEEDPFLNRTMRAALSLPLPERRIGLAAHDFAQFSAAGEVIYTRARRNADGPRVASRWLQRLTTFLGEDHAKPIRAHGEALLSVAQRIDAATAPPASPRRASFAPPPATRPKSLSITEIETLIRDPYAIYARQVLRLDALPPLLRETDAALRGTLIHDILAGFVERWKGPMTGSRQADAAECLKDIGRQAFANAGLPPETAALWQHRFEALAEDFIRWEAGRRDSIAASHCEVTLPPTGIADTGFQLRGRADRIDVLQDGSLCIIDYKTGANPSSAQARTLAPQLSLEGAMAMRGAFKEVEAAPLSDLLHVRLRAGKSVDPEPITRARNETYVAEELALGALERLTVMIRAYQAPDMPYVSQRAPDAGRRYAGDHDHLARVKEWSIGEADGDEPAGNGE